MAARFMLASMGILCGGIQHCLLHNMLRQARCMEEKRDVLGVMLW